MSGASGDRLLHLRALSGAAGRRRYVGPDAVPAPLRRGGLRAARELARISRSAAQHRRHGPHLRRRAGRLLRAGRLPVDYLRRHLHGGDARLHLGHDARAQRRSEHPRSGGPLSGRRHAAVHAPLLGAAARARRGGLPAQPRAAACQHGAGHLLPRLGVAHPGLLLRGDAASHRQNHRTHLPALRCGAGGDGPRTAGGGARGRIPDSRTHVAAQLPARCCPRAHRPDALHHHRLRRHLGLPCHAVAAHGPLCGQRARLPLGLLRSDALRERHRPHLRRHHEHRRLLVLRQDSAFHVPRSGACSGRRAHGASDGGGLAGTYMDRDGRRRQPGGVGTPCLPWHSYRARNAPASPAP